MSSVSNVNVKNTDYDIKDILAREHIADKNNPHEVTAEMLGVGSFKDKDYTTLSTKEELQNVITSLNNLIAALQQRLDNVETTADDAVSAANEAVKAVAAAPKESHKVDIYENNKITALHNFINGIKIDGHKIYYDVAQDTINFE